MYKDVRTDETEKITVREVSESEETEVPEEEVLVFITDTGEYYHSESGYYLKRKT